MPKQRNITSGIIWRKIKTLWSYPMLDKLLVPFVFALLGFARLTILFVPFRYYSNLLGQYCKTSIHTPLLNPEQISYSRKIGRIVRSTAQITPWESLCLAQALVASILLRTIKIPYILHFGLAKDQSPDFSDPFKAHAWITAGSVAVTGGRSLFRFTVVGTYVYPTQQDLCIYE